MFQFEIGVQSTLPQTLDVIDRKVSTEKVLQNVNALMERTKIDIHLDLIAGLPGESYPNFMSSVDTVMALEPEHLQIEPVKLLHDDACCQVFLKCGLRVHVYLAPYSHETLEVSVADVLSKWHI